MMRLPLQIGVTAYELPTRVGASQLICPLWWILQQCATLRKVSQGGGICLHPTPSPPPPPPPGEIWLKQCRIMLRLEMRRMSEVMQDHVTTAVLQLFILPIMCTPCTHLPSHTFSITEMDSDYYSKR